MCTLDLLHQKLRTPPRQSVALSGWGIMPMGYAFGLKLTPMICVRPYS
jgi:hypothetical protein